MKVLSILVAILALTFFVGTASAKGNKAAKPQILNGTITKIDGSTITIQPRAKQGADQPATVDVLTTASTSVTINGDTKALTDLAVGQKVKITLDTDGKTATAFTIGGKKNSKKNATPPATTPPAATQPTTQP